MISGIFRSSTSKDKQKNSGILRENGKRWSLDTILIGRAQNETLQFCSGEISQKRTRSTVHEKAKNASFVVPARSKFFFWFMLCGVSCRHTDSFGCFRNFISHQCVTMTISIWRIEVNADLPTKGKSLK